jgi:hypothetical protein
MIDVENIVFNTVATSLRSEFTGIFVSGENTEVLSTFPAATIVEMDNSVYQRTSDSSATENHATVMYQAEAYSNKASGRKAEAKSIMAVIDDEMTEMGFVRIGNSPLRLPNLDQSIYRIVARYRAVVGKNNNDYLTYRR